MLVERMDMVMEIVIVMEVVVVVVVWHTERML